MFPDRQRLKEIFKSVLQFELEFVRVTRIGVERMTRGMAAEFATIARELKFTQLGFYAICVAAFFIAMFPWIDYRITFASEEYADVGSKTKLVFLLPSLFGLLLATFNIPFRQTVYRVILVLTALIYVAGLIWPNPIHTSMHSGDFHVRFWTYLYGLTLAGLAVLAGQALSETTIHPERFQGRLLPELHPEEETSPRKRSAKSARA
ncbi:MAG: hypothetical protein JNM27_03525 [Leptospirales bacterium]|nr:hypothetical protein [Leptospirales bacterium]